MQTRSVRACLLLAAALALAVTATAQEGHPLTGTWYGDYGSGSQKRDLTVILKWDGRAISGTINPGPSATQVTGAVLDITPGKAAPQGQQSTTGTPPIFHVRFQADLPNAAGAAGPIQFEGTIENPVAGNRQIVGTWSRGTEKGTFQLRRL